jgi:hypothetical protein
VQKKNRTLGWIQNSSDTDSLKAVIRLFVYDSDINKSLRETKLPNFIHSEDDKKRFITLLSNKDKIQIQYADLKGKGKLENQTRKNASCSGIVQATIHGQGNKEYIDDWSADCFLRWAISLGFLDYDNETDLCSLSNEGKNLHALKIARLKKLNVSEQLIYHILLLYGFYHC